LLKIHNLEKTISDVTSEKTLKEIQISNLTKKIDNLEFLLLEKEELIESLNKSNQEKTIDYEKDVLITKIENLITNLSLQS